MKDTIIKIVFFGTPNFSIESLKCLVENINFDVQALITQEDKIVGRKKILTAPEIKQFVINNNDPKYKNIKIFQTKNINKDEQLINYIKSLKTDFFVVVAFGQILSNETLNIPKFGSINLHASLLPKYRGASPITASILNGDKETGITVMQMAKEMDNGPIYQQKEISILATDDITTLSAKLSIEGGKTLTDTLVKIFNNKINKTEQKHSGASYCSKISVEDGQINWKNDTSEKIANKIKAFLNWPSCYTSFKTKKLKLLKIDIDNQNYNKNAGESFLTGNNILHIATINGSIILKQIQLEGKNPCSAEDFLRGYKDLQNYNFIS